MLAVLPYLGVIISAIAELTRLLFDLAKEKNSDAIEKCAVEIESARASGDPSKLTRLIDKMKKEKKCN